MKLKELEQELQRLNIFKKPKLQYEQYPTSSHLSSHILYTAHQTFNDIENKLIMDLGCGGAILGIGASLLGASQVLAVDIDADVFSLARENCDKLDIANMDFVQADIEEDSFRPSAMMVDTVLMNPPFGTKTKKGIDVVFLQRALSISRKAVYSLHKTSTRNHLLRKAKEWGVECRVLAQLRFDIPAIYKFHKKASVDVEVDLLRFSK